MSLVAGCVGGGGGSFFLSGIVPLTSVLVRLFLLIAMCFVFAGVLALSCC